MSSEWKQGVERRQHIRIKKNFIIRFCDKNHPSLKFEVSQIENISRGGLCFTSTIPFSIGADMAIELRTPYVADTIYLEGHILHSLETIKGMVYVNHLKFHDVTVEALGVLEKIEKYNLNRADLKMKILTIGLIGLGTVGKGVAKLIKSKQAFIKARYGVEFRIKAVCDLKVDAAFLRSVGTPVVAKNFNDIIMDPDIDVVVELIGGQHPALEIIKGALANGKHVVTANKAVISTFGQELFELAYANARSIYFETAVLAGVPIIKTLTEGIAGNQYKSLYGIVNGTCNYILSEMAENGMSFDAAVKLAQAKGYAEADPSLDVNGKDSAHKLAVLVMLAMGKFIKVADIHTEGITHIAPEDLKYAEDMGLTIKLLAIAKKKDDGIEVRVHPTLISKKHSLASVKGVYNAVQLDADALGDVLLVGQGAGQMAAASGVFSDLINLALVNADGNHTWIGNDPKEFSTLGLLSMDKVETEFYIRLKVIDRPGVLSMITGILGSFGISIASVTQKMAGKNTAVPLVMLTHTAKEADVRKALEKISKLKEVKAKPVAIRMEQI